MERQEEVEIDLRRLALAVWRKAWLVVLSAVLCAALAFAGTYYFVTPLYKASAMFYVNNSSISVGDAAFSLSTGDLSAAKSLVISYIVILESRSCLNDVMDYAGVSYTYGQMKDMVSATAVNNTEVFQITVTSPDPQEAEKIANAIAYILPKKISGIIDGTSAKIVDYAVIPSSPSSPSYTKNAAVGFMIGFVLCAGVIVLMELFDTVVRNEEDIEQVTDLPILASVPDMQLSSSGGYSSYYASSSGKRTRSKKSGSSGKQAILMGNSISFAASEAYKLLRTKLQFFFTEETGCRVIGISSAMAGEGKSLTAVNLAYTLAQLDVRVLLVDCDMRRPSLAAKLPIQKIPGLSDCLTGQVSLRGATQRCDAESGLDSFDVIASGHNPPNPIELLSSEKMEQTIERLRESYDYIIMDLPPVGEVSDAMVASRLTDGTLLVARENYCNRYALADAVHQFEFVNTRILGLVLNCAGDRAAGYGYYHYGRYGRYGKYGYGSYSASGSSNSTDGKSA